MKRFKDNVKANLKKCNIDTNSWESLAQERSKWRETIHEVCAIHEKDKSDAAELKRKRRKTCPATQSKDLTTCNKCPHCDKICGSRIGLFSHL